MLPLLLPPLVRRPGNSHAPGSAADRKETLPPAHFFPGRGGVSGRELPPPANENFSAVAKQAKQGVRSSQHKRFFGGTSPAGGGVRLCCRMPRGAYPCRRD